MTTSEPGSAPPVEAPADLPPHAACYRRRLEEGPVRSWLWAFAQNLPVVGVAPQLYYAISRRTVSPLLWGSAGLLVGVAVAAVPILGRVRSTPVIECLAAIEPTPHPELEGELRVCMRLALPVELLSPPFLLTFGGLITVTSILGTRFGQNRAAQDARHRLGER